MKIVEHWLEGPDTERLRCTKNSRRMEVADTIVLHATEGANAMSSACYLARATPPCRPIWWWDAGDT